MDAARLVGSCFSEPFRSEIISELWFEGLDERISAGIWTDALALRASPTWARLVAADARRTTSGELLLGDDETDWVLDSWIWCCCGLPLVFKASVLAFRREVWGELLADEAPPVNPVRDSCDPGLINSATCTLLASERSSSLSACESLPSKGPSRCSETLYYVGDAYRNNRGQHVKDYWRKGWRDESPTKVYPSPKPWCPQRLVVRWRLKQNVASEKRCLLQKW